MEALRHHVRPTLVWVLATTAAAALAVVSPAHAEWSAPKRLARSRVWSYLQLAVARSDSGDETVAWRREETLEEALGGVEAATKGPDGPWHVAVLDSARRDGPSEIALGSGADGRATLAWERFSSEHATAPEVDVLTAPPGGHWTHPTKLVAADPEAGSVAMDVAPDGRAALVFHVGFHLSGIALRGADGRWDRTRRLPLGAVEGEPRVALLPGGGAAVAWEEHPYPGRRESVKAMFVGPRGEPRGPVQTLARGDEKELELKLAGNLRGDLLLAWRPRGASGPLVAATRNPGRRFGAPVTVSPGHDSEVSTAVDAEGDATVLFTHLLAGHEPVEESHREASPTGSQRTVVQDATKPALGTWRAAVDVPTPTGMSTLSPQIVAAPTSDELLATWTVAPTRAVFGATGVGGGWPPEASRDYTSTRVGAGEWSSPLPLTGVGASSATIALSDGGGATAAWLSSDPEPEAQHPFVNVEVSELTP